MHKWKSAMEKWELEADANIEVGSCEEARADNWNLN